MFPRRQNKLNLPWSSNAKCFHSPALNILYRKILQLCLHLFLFLLSWIKVNGNEIEALSVQRKQMELGDSMDLSSYLLKPVQRISKYSLLLQEILDECVPDQSGEPEEIQAALEVVRFQLRHGNDLLTMDAIRDCDVSGTASRSVKKTWEFNQSINQSITTVILFSLEHNGLFLTHIKLIFQFYHNMRDVIIQFFVIMFLQLNLNEQGQLIRQDEFWVIFRKKRSLRRVFLFQDVILFTKTKKNDRGDDVYVYKMSIKVCVWEY